MEKFYRHGLKFTCTTCGECCKLPGGRVELKISEAENISVFLHLTMDDFLETFCTVEDSGIYLKDNAKQHCIFWENETCAIYDVRPLQCRTFPFWPENLKSPYRWKQLRSFCEGVDRGKLHTAKQIETVRSEQRKSDRENRRANKQIAFAD